MSEEVVATRQKLYLVDGNHLTSRLVHFSHERDVIPEARLGSNLVGSKHVHPVQLGLVCSRLGLGTPDDLVVVHLRKHKTLSLTQVFSEKKNQRSRNARSKSECNFARFSLCQGTESERWIAGKKARSRLKLGRKRLRLKTSPDYVRTTIVSVFLRKK